MVGSVQRVVVARARAPRDAAVQHCLEYLGSWHPDFELEIYERETCGRMGKNTMLGTVYHIYICFVHEVISLLARVDYSIVYSRSTPVAQLAPRNLLTRWDVSSIPANGIFLTKN